MRVTSIPTCNEVFQWAPTVCASVPKKTVKATMADGDDPEGDTHPHHHQVGGSRGNQQLLSHLPFVIA